MLKIIIAIFMETVLCTPVSSYTVWKPPSKYRDGGRFPTEHDCDSHI